MPGPVAPPADLADALAAAKAAVDAELKRLLPLDQGQAPRIHDAIRHVVLSGGKRLRPLLCLFAGEALGASRADLLPCAAALELAHVFTLVHDDLPCMDDADLRRGVATIHKVWDEAIAVLAGDALLNLTYQVLATDGSRAFPADRVLGAIRILAEGLGLDGVVGGQAWDIDPADADPERLEQTHLMKTAAFFSAALCVGATLAGGTADHCTQLRSYARELGLAFQIKDDLLDAAGDIAATGKDARDAARGRTTYVSRYGVDGAMERMALHAERAREALEGYPNAGLLQGLAGYVVERAS
ncbi:MAG TPA: polyprenyl synthetase family protein [bacterium]|nr:polyprenyl synthetase family protein [bacterium]